MRSPDGDRYFPLRESTAAQRDAVTDSLGSWRDTIAALRREVSEVQGRYRCAASQPDLAADPTRPSAISARDLAVRMGALGRLQDALAEAEVAWRNLERQTAPTRPAAQGERARRPPVVIPGFTRDGEAI